MYWFEDSQKMNKMVWAMTKNTAANIEPKDTYFVINTTIANTNNAPETVKGLRAKNTPADVATPFPPLKDRKHVKVWPKMANMPTKTGSQRSSEFGVRSSEFRV